MKNAPTENSNESAPDKRDYTVGQLPKQGFKYSSNYHNPNRLFIGAPYPDPY